jgi:hypothetical protein
VSGERESSLADPHGGPAATGKDWLLKFAKFRGNPSVHLVEKNFKKCFYYKYLFFAFFQKCVSGLADFRDF